MSYFLLAASLIALAVTFTTPAAGLARLALGASLAMVLTAHLTPVVARAAARFGIVDRPDGRLKVHAAPVPYLGGLAVGLGFFVALSLIYRFDQRMTGMLLAGAIALLLGLVDDLGSLSWRAKFAGQGLCVLVLLKSGVAMHIAALPPWVNLLASGVWMLALINAMNLIDISDGLAAGVAMFASAAFVVAAVFDGAALLAILAATLFGALAGFLPHNFQPARIYLGDAGSMFLGIMLGGISLAGSYTAASTWGLAAPALILAVPLFDTALVMTLRLARGRNPFLGSPDHFAVRLRRRGWPARAIALTACLATAATALAGLMLLFAGPAAARGIIALVVAALASAGLWLARLDVDRAPVDVPLAPAAPDLPVASLSDATAVPQGAARPPVAEAAAEAGVEARG